MPVMNKFAGYGMMHVVIALLMTVAGDVPAENRSSAGPGRTRIDFNTGWLFSDSATGDVAAVALRETSFRHVDLPHTVALVPHAAIDTSVYARVSWYRKHFTLPESYREHRIGVEFQAVSKVAEVFCNGKRVGGHTGAYTPFTIDITNQVSSGGDNVLAVQVDSRQRKDIPPEGKDVDYLIGGGIVRDVALVVTNPVHVDWIYARCDTACSTCVALVANIVNQGVSASSGTVRFILTDTNGSVAARCEAPYALASGAVGEVHAVAGPVKNLRLWHPDHPNLYNLHAQLWTGAVCLDDYPQRIGVRSVAFDKISGVCTINGQPIKLRGLNRHETFPFIGRAAANRLQRRDAEILKYDFGCNIVRCSHYPQDPEFLERCDEIGLLVLEEMAGWNFVSAKPEWQKIALDNLSEMIRRDRNHPSIISFGVRVNQSADFRAFYTATNRIAHTLAPDRPTHGVRVLGRGTKSEFFEDVWAQNFLIPAGTPPELPWLTTESVGHNFPAHSWDNGARLVGQLLAHAAVQDSAAKNPMIAGLLGWCAFDYNSAYHYAENSVSYHGVADMFRIPKPAAYFYRSQADAAQYGPVVYIADRWEKFSGTTDVRVASNCDSVELFVNKRSIGKHAGSEYRSLPHPLFVWNAVPFKAGEIRAVGFIGGDTAATCIRRTTGPAVRLTITPDDTVLGAGGDMTRVVVAAVDTAGEPVPRNSTQVAIIVSGPADFFGESPIALENGETAFYIKTRSGENGTITCSAKGDKLYAAKAGIDVRGDNGKNGIK